MMEKNKAKPSDEDMKEDHRMTEPQYETVTGRRIKNISRDLADRKNCQEKINSLARFPAENPFPVLRISSDGTILYSNKPGEVLVEKWNCQTGQKVPQEWSKAVAEALKSGNYRVKETVLGQRILSFVIAPVPDEGYVNLYGRDITKQRQADDALRKSRDELESRVKDRTAELSNTIVAMETEVENRISAEKKTSTQEQRS